MDYKSVNFNTLDDKGQAAYIASVIREYEKDVKRKKIFVDPGKNTVKIFVMEDGGITQIYSFPSISSIVTYFRGEAIQNQFRMKFDLDGEPQMLILGAGISNGTYDMEAHKNTPHHIGCIYAAIHEFAEDNEEIDLIIGCPVEHSDNQLFVNKFKASILGSNDGLIEITRDNDVKTIQIKNIEVLAEGRGFVTRRLDMQNNIKTYKKNGVRSCEFNVVDIGGQNINYHLINKNTEIENFTSLDTAGMNHLYNELYKAYISQGDFNKPNPDWEEVLKTKKIDGLEEVEGVGNVAKFLQVQISVFLDNQLIRKLNEKTSINLQNIGPDSKIAFIGGGSLILRPYLETYFQKKTKIEPKQIVFSPSPIWDNCFSYAITYFANFGKKQVSMPKKKPAAELIMANVNNIGQDLFKNAISPDFEANYYKKTEENAYLV